MGKVLYKIFSVYSVAMLFVDLSCSLIAYNDSNQDSNVEIDIKFYKTDTNSKNYTITSKDGRDVDILNLPLVRPFTPVDPSENRSLYPVRIKVGESPCSHMKSRIFFMEANKRQIPAYDLLMNATVTILNQDYYFYDAEDLCISVDDELNIDVWQYDCSPDGLCVCGIYFGYVDPDISPNIQDNQVKYLEVDGLDRKLVVDNGECKSGFKGHCSLPTNNSTLPLMCAGTNYCVLDDTYGPIIVNEMTKQTYGICLPKEMAGLRAGADYNDENSAIAATVLSGSLWLFVQIMITQTFHIRETNLFSY